MSARLWFAIAILGICVALGIFAWIRLKKINPQIKLEEVPDVLVPR